MYLSEFKEFLLDFNNMTVTEAKCEGVFKHNFIVSGLTDDNFETLSIVFKYHPSHKYGVGLISKKQYDDMTTPMSVVSSNEPPYTESCVANLDDDMLGWLQGQLTHGKTYDVIVDKTNKYVVLNDKGVPNGYHHSWFTPVKLYDEDESELICRDIEFYEGDYIDKGKWTPDQLVHLSKFYKFYNLSSACENNHLFLIWDSPDNEWVSDSFSWCTGKEYHYNDLFYKEGE